jgi:hypothetical protein
MAGSRSAGRIARGGLTQITGLGPLGTDVFVDFDSTDGDARAAVPHGSFSYVSSEHGDIAAILIPFGTADKDAKNELYTEIICGETYVHIYNMLQDALYKNSLRC